VRPVLPWLAAGAALALAACATVAPQDSTDAAQAYACAGGKRFTASYALNGRRAEVTAGGRIYVLKPGEGGRFAANGVTLAASGVDARLDGAKGGPYRNCKSG
jgi:hypothetical protein